MCIDDNRLIADAMKRRISLKKNLFWSGWLGDSEAAFDRVIEADPDILMMDIDMPKGDPFALVLRLAESAPAIRAIMFSGHVRFDYIARAIDAGAWGYVSKNDNIENVLEMIQRVAGGEFVMSAEVEEAYSCGNRGAAENA